MAHYEVIIVGAGPAGLSTALHLQQMAPELAERTLILEKARHPRTKLCGGGVTPDAERVLGRLGLDVTEVPHVDLVSAHFLFEGKGIPLRLGETYAFRVIHREELDAWLAQKARERGLAILEETPVQRAILGEGGVELITSRGTYQAKVVVGADGAHSVIRRSVIGQHRSPFAYALVLWAPPNQQSLHCPDVGYFDFFCVSRGVLGYVWDFPILIRGQTMRSWGICQLGVRREDGRRRMIHLLAGELARHGYRLDDYPLYGESVPLFRSGGLFSAPHVLLVGDAAGVDGVFGEGIGPALGQGEVAARAICDAFMSGDFSFRNYRTDLLKSDVGRSLRRREVFASLFYRLRHPVIQRLIWWRSGMIIGFLVKNFLLGWTKSYEKRETK
ncbi:MAG: NAD(P)/FAD-dependent oxidoreductase [Chloroflexi bacterium]|nr:NAD(P)/FAD-dependent oxidoreductase [Chloroflexota bacterium]